MVKKRRVRAFSPSARPRAGLSSVYRPSPVRAVAPRAIRPCPQVREADVSTGLRKERGRSGRALIAVRRKCTNFATGSGLSPAHPDNKGKRHDLTGITLCPLPATPAGDNGQPRLSSGLHLLCPQGRVFRREPLRRARAGAGMLPCGGGQSRCGRRRPLRACARCAGRPAATGGHAPPALGQDRAANHGH
mgnify:CR=1 FL=1